MHLSPLRHLGAVLWSLKLILKYKVLYVLF